MPFYFNAEIIRSGTEETCCSKLVIGFLCPTSSIWIPKKSIFLVCMLHRIVTKSDGLSLKSTVHKQVNKVNQYDSDNKPSMLCNAVFV